tara:strand:+ start:66524 stop:67621 length:1098 start_codon:yes stop_codon:yes gene_type:complete
MSHSIQTGDTDQTLIMVAYDTSDWSVKENLLAADITSLVITRVGAADVSLASPTDKATPDAGHTDQAVYDNGGGEYLVDITDASVAAFYPSVALAGTWTESGTGSAGSGVLIGYRHAMTADDPSVALGSQSSLAQVIAAVITNAAGTDIATDIINLDTVADSNSSSLAQVIAAVITNATGTDIAADIRSIKVDTATTLLGHILDILENTNLLKPDGGIDVLIDSIIEAVVTNATGTDVSADIRELKAAVDAITGDATEAKQDQLIEAVITNAAGTDISADVRVVDVLIDSLVTETVSAATEPTGAPPLSATRGAKIDFLYATLRNKVRSTATAKEFYNNAGAISWYKDVTLSGTAYYQESEGTAS